MPAPPPDMTRELFILFVYDTQLCQKEEDDPQEAILYFYPNWVTDQQRLALCGQLMGATQFFLTAFSCPRILSLNSGKFAFEQYGQYLIAIGSDCNIPDWLIEHRASTLRSVLQLYHLDLDTICKNCNMAGNKFRDKLRQIFETFLPVLQYGIDVFGSIPTLQLPKSASNVFLEAIHILQYCQEKKGVLGGIVLYQNRVVATQLSASLTKSLVVTDPYRIKTPADNIPIPFHLPVGVQLMRVYIQHKEYHKLLQEATISQSLCDVVINRQKSQKFPSSTGKTLHSSKEHSSSMKRDISRIFTVPEEEVEMDFLDDDNKINEKHIENFVMKHADSETITPVPYISERKSSLTLDNVNISNVLHEGVVSICGVFENGQTDCADLSSNKTKIECPIPDVVKDAMKVQFRLRDLADKTEVQNVALKMSRELHRCQSLVCINQIAKAPLNRVPLRYYSFGLPQLTNELVGKSNDISPDEVSVGKHFFHTITDPFFPVFKCDGLPMSRALFDEHLAQHYELLNREKGYSSHLGKPEVTGSVQMSYVNVDEKDGKVDLTGDEISPSSPQKQSPEILQISDAPSEMTSKQEVYRRSLSLPLKSLANDNDETDDTRRKATSFTTGALESPSVRTRTLGSLPLTPLMSKLSMLALEERSSGFCSRNTTPSEFADGGFSTDEFVPTFTMPPSLDKKPYKSECEIKSDLERLAEKIPEKAALYVFGQLNMALLLLMDEDRSQDPELIHSLWETCVSSLGKLETHLNHCLEHSAPSGGESDSYSYISLDPQWDMMQRGGSWGCLELDMVGSLHHDFQQTKNLTEIVVRCEDSTVYGYQCGKTEVFYQQSANASAGLPTPADLMGVVPLKARRRLERDHGIVLL